MSVMPLDCLAHFEFGHGTLVVQVATVDGKPSLIILPSKYKGIPGELAHPDEPVASDPEVMRRAVVLTFQSETIRDAVCDAIHGPAN